jgi:hypothetical protein
MCRPWIPHDPIFITVTFQYVVFFVYLSVANQYNPMVDFMFRVWTVEAILCYDSVTIWLQHWCWIYRHTDWLNLKLPLQLVIRHVVLLYLSWCLKMKWLGFLAGAWMGLVYPGVLGLKYYAVLSYILKCFVHPPTITLIILGVALYKLLDRVWLQAMIMFGDMCEGL